MDRLLPFHPSYMTKKEVLGLSFLFFATTVVADSLTGPELNLAIFYLLPIALVSWFFDRGAGIYFCLFCAATCFTVNLKWSTAYSHYLIPYWNLFARFGLYATIAILLAKVRSLLHTEADLARRDFLTGLPNNRAFYELAALAMKRPLSSDQPLTLAYVDIDGLKWINSRFGFVAGDQALCSIARTITESMPRKELVARVGGTVFALLLPNTSADLARYILADVLTNLKGRRQKSGQPMTFYLSALTYLQSPTNVGELLYEAERVLSRTREKKTDDSALEIVERAQPLI
jgi:diguanylate cyclase (GGDEF)-like protein